MVFTFEKLQKVIIKKKHIKYKWQSLKIKRSFKIFKKCIEMQNTILLRFNEMDVGENLNS